MQLYSLSTNLPIFCFILLFGVKRVPAFPFEKKKLYKGETKINTIADRHTNLKVIYSLLFEHKKNAENWNNWEKQL